MLALSLTSYTLGEYYSKKIANGFSWSTFVIILVCYAGSGLFWIPAIRQTNAIIVLD